VRRVTAESVAYCWLTVAVSLALWPVAMGPWYGVAAVVLGSLLLVEAHRLHRRASRGVPPLPMRLFHWSTTYLALLFVAVAVDALMAG
jgi:protoheme IX farnesyltransferase